MFYSLPKSKYVILFFFLGICAWYMPKGTERPASMIEVPECPKLLGEYAELMAVEMVTLDGPTDTTKVSHDLSSVVINHMEKSHELTKKCNEFFKAHRPPLSPHEQDLFDEARRVAALALYYKIPIK